MVQFTLTQRSIEIFRRIVEAYVETGEPVGSRTLSKLLGLHLSAATIRNVMADLEDIGLLYAPHTSAGRLPTDAGLRFFVNGLLEIGTLSSEEKTNIEILSRTAEKTVETLLEEATLALSGLSKCAGLVIAPKIEENLKHIEFVAVSPYRVLVVLVTSEGSIENRILEVPEPIPPSALVEASNYLNYRLAGRTLQEAKTLLTEELREDQAHLDQLTQNLVKMGLASWTQNSMGGTLIVRGQANLLEDVSKIEDLSRLKNLFHILETKETLLNLLDASIDADGVQIYIGAESPLYALSDCSMILSSFTNAKGHIIGAVGVIGPTRLNYGRIIPMVDYTAKIISRLIGKSG